MDVNIKVAQTAGEKEAVYRFRYSIYHSELRKESIQVCHDKQMIFDEYDDNALILTAEVDGQIVGTMRTNSGVNHPLPQAFKDKFKLEELLKQVGDDKISVTSFFMVMPEFRKTEVGALLISEIYARVAPTGTQFDFCLCELPLLKIYQRLGYRQYKPLHYLDKGELRVHLVLCVKDYDYLLRCQSPFIFSCPEDQSDQGAGADLLSKFYPGFKKEGNLNARNKIKSILNNTYAPPRNSFFGSISSPLLKEIFSLSIPFSLSEGEMLNLSSNEQGTFFLLSGNLAKAKRESEFLQILRPFERVETGQKYSAVHTSALLYWSEKNWKTVLKLISKAPIISLIRASCVFPRRALTEEKPQYLN